jgi:uncharacterized protein YjbI with pentapeptide repeats
MTTPKKPSTRPRRSRFTEERIRELFPTIVVSLYIVLLAVTLALTYLFDYSLEWHVNALIVLGAIGIAVWGLLRGLLWLLDSGARHMAGGLAPLTRDEHDELTPKDRLELTSAARQSIFQVGTGLAVFLGVIFTAAGLFYTARTLETTQQGQITERYTRTIDQLGSDKLDVRLGGIYALERLAYDSPSDTPTVANVLSTYIREHSRSGPAPRRHPSLKGEWGISQNEGQYELPADVEAAFTILRKPHFEDVTVGIDLHGARLPGVFVDFEGANLSGADLREASIDRPADFSHANMRKARIDGELTGAQFKGTDLEGAEFWQSDLTDLTNANFEEADMRKVTMRNVKLTDAWMQGVDLRGADLDQVRFNGAELEDADLQGVDLSKTSGLTHTQLSKANTDRTTRLPPGLS